MNSVEWNDGMERENGLLEWNTGLDYWSAMPTNWLCPGMRVCTTTVIA